MHGVLFGMLKLHRLNKKSAYLNRNEVKEWLAKTTGGHGTGIYSDTNA